MKKKAYFQKGSSKLYLETVAHAEEYDLSIYSDNLIKKINGLYNGLPVFDGSKDELIRFEFFQKDMQLF